MTSAAPTTRPATAPRIGPRATAQARTGEAAQATGSVGTPAAMLASGTATRVSRIAVTDTARSTPSSHHGGRLLSWGYSAIAAAVHAAIPASTVHATHGWA